MTDVTATQEAPPTAVAEATAPSRPGADAQTVPAVPTPQTASPSPQPADAPAQDEASVEVRPARLPETAEQTVNTGGGQMDILLNTTMPVTASLGQVVIQVRQLLQLGSGSVVKLDRRVGEPIDLYIRGERFAIGQLVVVGEHLGVRIKEILPAAVPEGAAGTS